MILTLKKNAEGRFEADVMTRPGSPPVGRGRTMKEALGDWLINNQDGLDVYVDVEPSAQRAEDCRRTQAMKAR